MNDLWLISRFAIKLYSNIFCLNEYILIEDAEPSADLLSAEEKVKLCGGSAMQDMFICPVLTSQTTENISGR